jgi:hypothetical protein
MFPSLEELRARMARLAEQTDRLRDQTEVVLALSSRRRRRIRQWECGDWGAERQLPEADDQLISDRPELN